MSSAKISPDRFGTDGGRSAGGRSNDVWSSPGKTSDGVVKKCAKPREKKFGESPGDEKISRGI